MKKLTSLLFAALLLIFTIIPIADAYAIDIGDSKYDMYRDMVQTGTNYSTQIGDATIFMHDMADKFSDAEEQDIIDSIAPLVKDEDVHVFFITCDVNHNKDPLDFMEEYVTVFDHTYENNIIFGLNMATRDISISSMGEYLDALGVNSVDACIDKGINDLSNGNYARGMKKIALQATEWIINDPDYVGATVDKPGTPVTHQYTTWDFVQDNWLTMTIISTIITAISGGIMIANHKSANKQVASQIYLKDNGYYKVLNKDEVFETSYTTISRNYYKQSSSSGSSRGGSSHRSSSGRSSGGSRKF